MYLVPACTVYTRFENVPPVLAKSALYALFALLHTAFWVTSEGGPLCTSFRLSRGAASGEPAEAVVIRETTCSSVALKVSVGPQVLC